MPKVATPPPALILAIESAGLVGGVCLLNRDTAEVIGLCDFTGGSLHSQRTLPSIDWLMQRTGHDLSSVCTIAVSAGPGSFTGLRIGLSIAQALAWQLRVPAIAVSSLEAIAYNAALSTTAMRLCALIDARRGKFFTATFQRTTTADGTISLQRLTEDSLLTTTEIAAHLSPDTLLCGDYAKAPELTALATPCPRHCAQSSARAVALLALRDCPTSANATHAYVCQPRYVLNGYEQ